MTVRITRSDDRYVIEDPYGPSSWVNRGSTGHATYSLDGVAEVLGPDAKDRAEQLKPGESVVLRPEPVAVGDE